MIGNILTPAVVISLLVAGSATFAVFALTGYVRDRDELGSKLSKVDRQLNALHREIVRKQAAIKELQASVDVLKPLHDRLSQYHEQLLEIQMAGERQQMCKKGAKSGRVPGQKRPDPWE